MNIVARKFDALELAGFSHAVFTYVRSDENPADGPSRWRKHGRKGKKTS